MNMLQKIFEAISSVHPDYSIDIILLKTEHYMVDREYVLFYVDQSWSVIGPVDYMTSNILVKTFKAEGIRSFISCEEEFIEKGTPHDFFAIDYFPENELNWQVA